MAVYFVTGSLGGGKSLAAMSKIDDYLRRGAKIATNMNLNLEHMCGPDNKYSRVMRVPDGPSIDDLTMIGLGSSVPGEKNHGLLVLDELGTWFNARDFGDKGRKDVIKFCIHLRKKRWDVLFLVQDFAMVDKQMRGNITQYLVTCQRAQELWIFKIFPKFHIATVRLRSKLRVGSWWYRSKHLYAAYDTEQLYFTSEHVESKNDMFVDDELSVKEKHDKELNGLYHLLPPGYLGEKVQNEIRARHRREYMGRAKFVGWCALMWLNSQLWIPLAVAHFDELAVVESVVAVDAITGDPGLDAEPVAEPVTFQDMYGHLRVRSHARFGRRVSYRFYSTAGDGVWSDAELAELGIKFKPEGPNQVTLISPDNESLIVTR